MNVRWTPTALRDIQSVSDHIAAERPSAAGEVVERILQGIDNLSRFPEIGRAGRVAGTRELIILPFVIVYRQRRGAVHVLAIIHGARRWPGSF
jgi:addiction module RelE/StbE family toxin